MADAPPPTADEKDDEEAQRLDAQSLSPVQNVINTGAAKGYHIPTIDMNNFVDPQAENEKESLSSQDYYQRQRKANQMTAAQLAPQQTAQVYNPGSSQSALAGWLAPAQTGTASSANAAQLASDAQFRNQQQTLASALARQAYGNAPSAADIAYKQNTDRALAQQVAAAASARGAVNPMLAARQLANNAATTTQAANQQAFAQRIQEQQAAQQALTGVLQGARGQDITGATTNAQLAEQANLTNAQLGQNMTLANMGAVNDRAQAAAQLAQQNNQFNAGQANDFNMALAQLATQNSQFNANQGNTLNTQQGTFNQQANVNNLNAQVQQQQQEDAMTQFYQNAMLGVAARQQQGTEDYNTTLSNWLTQNASIAQRVQAEQDSNAQGWAGMGLSALAGAAMAMSDEEEKTNLADGTGSLGEFISNMGSGMKQQSSLTNSMSQPGNTGGMSAMNEMNNMMNIGKNIRAKLQQDSTATPTPQSTVPDITVSDEDEKTDVSSGYSKEKSFLDALGTHQYTYKHPDMPGAGHGTYVSPMAQELEKSELGRSMVQTDPATGIKAVDYGKGFGAMLAAQAMNNKRLDKIEEALKRRGK